MVKYTDFDYKSKELSIRKGQKRIVGEGFKIPISDEKVIAGLNQISGIDDSYRTRRDS